MIRQLKSETWVTRSFLFHLVFLPDLSFVIWYLPPLSPAGHVILQFFPVCSLFSFNPVDMGFPAQLKALLAQTTSSLSHLNSSACIPYLPWCTPHPEKTPTFPNLSFAAALHWLFIQIGSGTRHPLSGLGSVLAPALTSSPSPRPPPASFASPIPLWSLACPLQPSRISPIPEPSGSYLYHSFGSCEGVSNLVNHLYVSIGLISSNNYNLEFRGQTFHIGELSTQHLAPSKP